MYTSGPRAAQRLTVALALTIIACGAANAGAAESSEGPGAVMKLHSIPWTIDGNPVLGTYGADRLEDLQRVRDVPQLFGAINGLAHAYCDIESDKEQMVQMRLCTDDDAWVRLNGNEIYRFTGTRGLDFDKDIVPLTLPRGTSRIEVKSHNRAGMWGIFMRFTDPNGQPLEGLQFSPTG